MADKINADRLENIAMQIDTYTNALGFIADNIEASTVVRDYMRDMRDSIFRDMDQIRLIAAALRIPDKQPQLSINPDKL